MMRIAAVGDLHIGLDSVGTFEHHLDQLSSQADALLLAGDLTRVGDPAEAAVLADALADVELPKIGVLGNHDYHSDQQAEVTDVLEGAGVVVLEGGGVVVDVGSARLGVAGTKGFGGGFVGASGSDFGEPEMKAFVRHTKDLASRLEESLCALEADVRVALLHYAPTDATLQGERLEIYPFLGSHLLGEAIDRAGADLVIHGHAHAGSEKGLTPGGIHVRNVAQPVIGQPYHLYCLGDGPDVECRTEPIL
ncbi:MAG: metallophosphoesterase [Actinomycetota bacterium]|jgi:Icc-related predicted phosphoesterase|nr:metallophosphoesterase [Actinomycetota bacterium]